MYSGNSISSSYENVLLRLPLGSNDQEDSGSFHPNQNELYLDASIESNMSTQIWEEVIETHHLPTPDTVGASMTSEKVRIDEGTIPDNILSHNKNLETSTLDRQPPDYEDLGIFFSPTEEINEDIIYTLGSFRMDDYIGSPLPSAQSASIYEDLKDIKDVYFQKVERRFNYWDYIKMIQNIDHTLFKLIEQFVPFKANTKTGLLIEPHFLERNKIAREIPVRSDGQTMTTGSHQTFEVQLSTDYQDNLIHDIDDTGIPNTPAGEYEPGTYVVSNNNLSNITSSKTSERIEQGTNGTIEIYDNHLDPFLRDDNFENNHSCQAPIKPLISNKGGVGLMIIGNNFIVGPTNPSSKPFAYKAHESSTLLGMATKGRGSRRYYQYRRYNKIS